MKRGKNEVFYLVDGKDGGIKITTKKPQKKEEKKKETKVAPKKEVKKEVKKPIVKKKVEKPKEPPIDHEDTKNYKIYRDNNAQLALQRGILRSLKWDQKLKLTIWNYSTKKVDIDWINYQGKPKSYGAVQSQKMWTQNTFATHPWALKVKNKVEVLFVMKRGVSQVFYLVDTKDGGIDITTKKPIPPLVKEETNDYVIYRNNDA